MHPRKISASRTIEILKALEDIHSDALVRQWQCMQMWQKGHSKKEIAAAMGLSRPTVFSMIDNFNSSEPLHGSRQSLELSKKLTQLTPEQRSEFAQEIWRFGCHMCPKDLHKVISKKFNKKFGDRYIYKLMEKFAIPGDVEWRLERAAKYGISEVTDPAQLPEYFKI